MNKKDKKYKFGLEITKKLSSFKLWLKKLRYSENSIRQKSNYAGYFLTWLEKESLEPEAIRYNDILSFIDYCKSEKPALSVYTEQSRSGVERDSKKLINNKLLSIRNFYEYLKEKNPNIINPAANLYLKGIIRKIPANIINFEELEKLYQSFKTTTNRDKRNKVILSLLIYQGLTTEELHQLEPIHLELKKGRIYVPGNRRRNSRKLELKSFQILELHEYINFVRPKIIEEITKPKPARKPNKINREKINNQLFISINGSENIKGSLWHLFKNIQKTNPEILHSKQIRISVITNWLKTYNLRQVQYFAGHKYVSSTERYQLNNLDNLQNKLEKYHPHSGF